MADIQTFFDGNTLRADFAVSAGSLSADADIKTAVLISLFTDRRAEEDDTLPDPSGSKRGWWGDALAQRRIGSRLWLLGREKELREVVSRAREYTREALAWLVEDGVASRVDVDAAVIAPGVLGLRVIINRNNKAPEKFNFDFAWRGI